MRLRELAKYLGGLALAIALLAWVLRDTDLSEVRAHLGTVHPALLATGLALAALLNLAHNVFRVLRWRVLLAPVREGVPFRPMFDAVILGYMASWTLPGRLGELVRPALLSGRERLPLGPCLGSVFADRLLDGLAVVVLFAIGAVTTPLALSSAVAAGQVRRGSWILLAVVAAGFVVLIAAASRRVQLERKFAVQRGPFAWIARLTLELVRGTEALSSPRLLARALAHTALAWALIVFGTWSGIRASGVDVGLGAVSVIMPLLALGIALPTPGGAGGYHLAMKFGLVQLFGVDEAAAVAAGLLVHLAIVVTTVALGVVLLVLGRVAFGDLLAAARQVRELGAAAEPVSPASALGRTP